MSESRPDRKAANEVAAWDRFLETESGCYPPKLAAAYLKMTVQGVHAAADRGWIRYFMVGRERFYSRRDVYNYRWTGSRKFKDNRPGPQHLGKQDLSHRKTAAEKRLDEAKERAAKQLLSPLSE